MKDGVLKGRWAAVLAVVVALVLVVAACGPAPAGTAATQKVVRIGSLEQLTGGAAAATAYAHQGQADYFEYANDQELIPGVRIDYLWADTGLQVAQEISTYRKFLDQDVPFILAILSVEHFKKLVDKDHVPMLAYVPTADVIYPPGWLYAMYPTWAESFAVWGKWVMDNWKEDRPPKLALMGTDEVSGVRALDEAIPYVESLGIEFLPTEYVGWVPIDSTTQLLRLAQQEVDYVFICPIWTTALPILRDAERLGLTDQIKFAGLENTQSVGMIEALGPALDGYTAPRTVPWYEETEIPGIQLLHELRQRGGSGLGYQGDDSHPVVAAAIAVEAVRRAIEDVGYENLDGAAVKAALDSFDDFDVYGLVQISYTPEDHRGWNKARVYQVKDGKVMPASDWMEAPMIKE